MHAEEQAATNQTERPIFGLPVDTTVLFSDKKGVYKPRIEKNKTKLLQKLGFLERFLDADEKIMFVTTGCSPFTYFEQRMLGPAWLQAVKRALFVFTDKRLFHIPTTHKYDYRGSIAQVLYQDCRRLQVKGAQLVAEYHSGKKDKFFTIPRADRAIIKRFNLTVSASDRPSECPQRNHLCPNCTHILPAGADTCPSCGLKFKNQAEALKYSLLLPGGGFFYTNHPYLGACAAVAELWFLVIVLMSLAAGLSGDAEALFQAEFFGALLPVERLMAMYHARKFLAEFIPRDVKALLSGQPVRTAPQVQTELPPVPPIPAQQKQRLEDILSLR